MTNIDRVSELLPDYPCLWSPRDPNYHNAAVKDETLKQLLEKCKETEDKLDMPTLVGLIDIVKSQQKIQLETNVTKSEPQHEPMSDLSIVTENEDTKEMTVSVTNLITSAIQPVQMSDTEIVMENDGTEENASESETPGTDKSKLTFEGIVSEFPCLLDPSDLNYRDKTLKNHYKEVAREKFNLYSSVQITRADFERMLITLKGRRKRETDKAPKSKSPEKEKSKPTLKEIVSEFPCLWDPNDMNYPDKVMRRRYKQILLEKINRYSSIPITRADLNRKLLAMNAKNARRDREMKKEPTLKTAETDESKPTFKDIVSEFPCLWDRSDMNFRNIRIKRRCKQMLLEKINRYSSVPITPADLDRKLFTLKPRKSKPGKPKPKKPKAAKTKPPSESNLPSTASDNSQRTEKPTLSTEVTETGAAREHTLEEIVVEYPCLWDHNDLNFTDVTMKERSRQKILERYNSVSTTKITMEQLRKKIDTLRCRLNIQRRKKRSASNQPKPPPKTTLLTTATLSAGVERRHHHALEDMVEEFPCLWDPTDPYRNNHKMKMRCHEILLERFNQQSSVQITMEELKRKLHALRIRQKRSKTLTRRSAKPLTRALPQTDAAKKYTLEEMVAEFPCLWDPNDLNRYDLKLKARCRDQLLDKFNKLSSEPIDMKKLIQKLRNLNGRLRQREAQARLAGENAADPARVLTWNLPQEPTNLDASQAINESQDTANHVVVGAVISFDWCRLCGEVKKQYVDATCDETPYIAMNKTKLAVNDLNIELDFGDNKLPTNICEDCDKKIVDMCKFVELVKSTQDKFNNLVNTETQKPTQDEAEKNENSEQIKCQVTIDLNAITVPRLGDENTQEVPGTRECTDENEIKMKMMRNIEPDSDSDEDNLVIKIEDPYDDDNDYKIAEQSNNDLVHFTSVSSCDVDENVIEIKSKIEVGPITISKASNNVLEELDKRRVSTDTSQSLLESFNGVRHRESVGVTANDATFRDSKETNLDQVITLDNGISIVFGGNINSAQATIKDICEESAANTVIKNEVVDMDSDTDEEQGGKTLLNKENEITVKEENIESDDSIINKDYLIK